MFASAIAVVSMVFDGTPLMLTAAIALCSLVAAGLSRATLRGTPQEAVA